MWVFWQLLFTDPASSGRRCVDTLNLFTMLWRDSEEKDDGIYIESNPSIVPKVPSNKKRLSLSRDILFTSTCSHAKLDLVAGNNSVLSFICCSPYFHFPHGMFTVSFVQCITSSTRQNLL